ncbi:MAG: hypothetical protein QNK36_20265 [Colwellia sp.]|nr:hypothetical protein [Colwellia sp.]
MKKILILAVIIFVGYKIFSPDVEERYDVGFSDGYAVGYNTECKIRTTMIEGDWDSEGYSSGYNDGKKEGITDCRNKK